jgi:hypothetical protein
LDLSGEDVRLCFCLGSQVANASRLPAWKPGAEFETARKKALAEVTPLKPAAGTAAGHP